MRDGEGLRGLSLEFHFIPETCPHILQCTPCLLTNPSSCAKQASLNFCYFNQGSHLNQYFNTVLSLMFIILSLIHQEKVKNMLDNL